MGVGTQDSFSDAGDFVERHGITFQMLWEEAFAAWQGFGIQRQPASILVSADGARIMKWQGELDDETRAEALRLGAAA